MPARLNLGLWLRLVPLLLGLISASLRAESPGEIIFGPSGERYTLEESIGYSRGGQVFKAKRDSDGKIFAYKTLPPFEYTFAGRPALKIAKWLQGKDEKGYMAKTEEFGLFRLREGKQAAMVSEFLEGNTLYSASPVLQGDPKYDAKAVLELRDLSEQYIRIVMFAAKHGVVLGDAKPANLWLSRDTAGKPKLRVFDYDSVGYRGSPVFIGREDSPDSNHPMMDLEVWPAFLDETFVNEEVRERTNKNVEGNPEAQAALRFLDELKAAFKETDPDKRYLAVKAFLQTYDLATEEEAGRLKPFGRAANVVNTARLLTGWCLFAVRAMAFKVRHPRIPIFND